VNSSTLAIPDLGHLTFQAHYVGNYQSSTFTAICSLKAQARWAVTGTPLQNRLGDIATMCQFLRVYPYGDRKAFHRDIINP
jgi:SNF2 family DNA or RNA helicase